jgi:hypothetical protein
MSLLMLNLLQRRGKPPPPQLTASVTGRDVKRTMNIAEAGLVVFRKAPRQQSAAPNTEMEAKDEPY